MAVAGQVSGARVMLCVAIDVGDAKFTQATGAGAEQILRAGSGRWRYRANCPYAELRRERWRLCWPRKE